MSVTLIILILTVLVSIVAFGNRELMSNLVFSPWEIKREKQFFRFITYGFVHADFIHLFVNMWVLYIFGEVVEDTFRFLYPSNGSLNFILLYFGGLMFSTLISYGKNHNNPQYSAVGASGAISSVTFAFILMYPMQGITIFPIPIELPAFVFGILYLAYEWFMGRRANDNIGHDAHFYGALYGIVFVIALDYRFAEMFISNF